MSLRRPTWRTVKTAALVVAIFGALWFNQERGLKAIAVQTHDGLCALHDDVERRRDASVAYLEEHPRGVISPVTNAVIITPAQIRQGIDNQTSTLTALDESGLVCD